ncbi:hypothetical protein A9993_03325 [Rahnella victoriana]|nr:hypothetical protein A9993_03325 [Rahnella victoriana]
MRIIIVMLARLDILHFKGQGLALHLLMVSHPMAAVELPDGMQIGLVPFHFIGGLHLSGEQCVLLKIIQP